MLSKDAIMPRVVSERGLQRTPRSFDLALEGDTEYPDARCGSVTMEVRTFNETITK